MGNRRILGARGCVRQGVLWEEILTMLPWTLSRRMWERRANPGAEDQRRNRRKRGRGRRIRRGKRNDTKNLQFALSHHPFDI